MAVKGVAARTHAILPGTIRNKAAEVAVTAWAVDLVTSIWKHTEPAIELLTPEPPIKLQVKLPSRRMVSRRNKCFNLFGYGHYKLFLTTSAHHSRNKIVNPPGERNAIAEFAFTSSV